MGFLGRRLTDKERAEELFSPYLDGQVTDEERMFLERPGDRKSTRLNSSH